MSEVRGYNQLVTAAWAQDAPEELGNPDQNIPIDGSPSAVMANGVLNIVYGSQGHLRVAFSAPKTMPSQDWTSLTNGQAIASDPSVVLFNQGGQDALNIFAIDPSGNLIFFLGTGYPASPPQAFNLSQIAPGAAGLALTGSPAAMIWNQNYIAIAARTNQTLSPVLFILFVEDLPTTCPTTFIVWNSLSIGSDPFLLATGQDQLSLIAEDLTQQQIVRLFGPPVLPPTPQNAVDRASLMVPLKPGQIAATVGLTNPNIPGRFGSVFSGAVISGWFLSQVETRAQNGSATYQFVDTRPSAVLNQDGSISVFAIGSTDIESLEAQHLLELGWNQTTPSDALDVTDLTDQIPGGVPLAGIRHVASRIAPELYTFSWSPLTGNCMSIFCRLGNRQPVL